MIYRELGFLSIIWLGSSHIPSPPFPGVSKLPLVFSLPVTCVSPIELTDERWGGGDGEDPNHTTARKLVLYKSFNTLCLFLSSSKDKSIPSHPCFICGVDGENLFCKVSKNEFDVSRAFQSHQRRHLTVHGK
jgi:hypothetical protein